MNCKDCKHWDKDKLEPISDAVYRRCHNAAGMFYGSATVDESRMLVTRVVTSPDFGCIKFEENDT